MEVKWFSYEFYDVAVGIWFVVGSIFRSKEFLKECFLLGIIEIKNILHQVVSYFFDLYPQEGELRDLDSAYIYFQLHFFIKG